MGNPEEFLEGKLRGSRDCLGFGLDFLSDFLLLLESLNKIDSLDADDSGLAQLNVNLSLELLVLWLELVDLTVDELLAHLVESESQSGQLLNRETESLVEVGSSVKESLDD